MPQPLVLVVAIVAVVTGCASRQRPSEYLPESALSPQAQTATPAVVTRAFEDDLPEAQSAPEADGAAKAGEEEHHHGHHHH